MPKRTSRDELDSRLNTAARDAFLLDMQAAGGDIGRVSLVVAQWHAEEMTRETPTRKSGMVRFFESTLIGKPIAILVENIEASIAEHGPILGTARGLLIGIVVAAALIAGGEAIAVVFDLGRYWVQMRYVESRKSEIRAGLVNEDTDRAMKSQYVDAPPRPPEPTLNLTDPVTQSEVHFVEITEDQYENAPKAITGSDDALKSRLQSATGQLASTTNILPKGTHYTPCKQTPSDPYSIVAITGDDGTFGLLVKLRDGRPVIIPASEYQPYLKPLTNADQRSPY